MAELLTRAIAEEYRKRAKALPDTAGQDIRERRELRIELQNRCGITELQAVNILNGFHADSYIVSEYRKAAENASEKAQDGLHFGMARCTFFRHNPNADLCGDRSKLLCRGCKS